jgi:6-phosphogluconolactonase (cycloisomerase 2 family)
LDCYRKKRPGQDPQGISAKEMAMDFRVFPLTLLVIVASTLATAGPDMRSEQEAGFVYIATNQPSGNTVIQFSRSPSGALLRRAEVSTGGLGGTGNGVGALDPLGSQDSLLLLGSGTQLLVVNAGSNTLASMAAAGGRLELRNRVESGGQFPNSVAAHENLVYVLNAHGTPNVVGFRLTPNGKLNEIPFSSRDLPGGPAAAPHDLRFTPDGASLLVTEGGTNRIDLFEVGANGLLSLRSSQPAAGSGPFGFKFGRHGTLLVANANSASVSSYAITPAGELEPITASLPTGQMASCWISLAPGSRQAFISNTGSGTLSSYEVDPDGRLLLSAAVSAAVANSAPIDSALSDDGRFLYVDDSALGRILIFAVSGATVTLQAMADGLPTTLQGIAAR